MEKRMWVGTEGAMRKLVVLAVAVAGAGCGGGGGGAATPEGVVQALIDAARARDVEAAVRVFPNAEMLAEYLECPADARITARLKASREGIGAEMGELGEMAFLRRESEGDEVQEFKAGDAVDDCRAKKDLGAIKTRIVVRDGGGQEDGDVLRFLRLGDRYYLASF